MSKGTEFTDNQNINNDAELWRRIPRDWWKPDKNLNNALRPSSQAFQNYPNTLTMSVCIADFVRESGRSQEDLMTDYKGFALASITAGIARDCEQVVTLQPENHEPAHAHVCGEKPRGIRKRLAKAAVWVIAPPA